MGKEFKAKGVDVALAPVIGPLGRIATGGRNWVRGFDLSVFRWYVTDHSFVI
jgi:hypothetical protein